MRYSGEVFIKNTSFLTVEPHILSVYLYAVTGFSRDDERHYVERSGLPDSVKFSVVDGSSQQC